MVILAGLNGLWVVPGDRGSAGLALAGEGLYKHGWGVVGDALAEPLFAVRTPHLRVDLSLLGPLGQAGHRHPLHIDLVAHGEDFLRKPFVELLQLGLPLGIQGAAEIEGLVVALGVVPLPPLTLLESLDAAELVVVLRIAGPALPVQFAVQPGNLGLDVVHLAAQLPQVQLLVVGDGHRGGAEVNANLRVGRHGFCHGG